MKKSEKTIRLERYKMLVNNPIERKKLKESILIKCKELATILICEGKEKYLEKLNQEIINLKFNSMELAMLTEKIKTILLFNGYSLKTFKRVNLK